MMTDSSAGLAWNVTAPSPPPPAGPANTTWPSADAFDFSNMTGVWLTGTCCMLGLLGSSLTCVVLAQAFRRSPMFFVLRAVAATDLVFLLSVLLVQTAVNVYPLVGVLQTCFRYRAAIQLAVWPVLMTAQMVTVWLTVLVSAERYVAICFPLRAASICTLTRVRRAVAIVVVAAAAYNAPRYFEFYVKMMPDGSSQLAKTAVAQTPLYRYVYACVLYAIFLFFLPLGLLIFLNASLVAALRRGRRRWLSMQTRQRREQNLTVIPLAIVLVFFVCAVPALGVNVVDAIDTTVFTQTTGLHFLIFANLLVVLNSTSNFFIYCLLGRKFRQRLWRIASCYRCRPHQRRNSRPDAFSLSQYSQSKASKVW